MATFDCLAESANFARLIEDLRTPRPRHLVEGVPRAASADETLRRLRQHAARLGITREANITGLDFLGIPVFMICRPGSRGLAVAQGKGLTDESARISGLMESIESAHAEAPDLELRYASRRELQRRATVVDPALLERMPDAHVDDDTLLLWTPAWDLLSSRQVWLPYETVHTDYSMPRPPCSGYFRCSSDGLGAGNDALEAVLQGALEQIERRVVNEWDAARSDGQRIDLSSIDDADVSSLVQSVQARGAEIALWAIPCRVGLPVVLCRIHSAGNELWPVGIAGEGSGCALSPAAATRRAILEAVQSRLTIIAGSRDDIYSFQHQQLLAISEAAFDASMSADEREMRFDALPNTFTPTLDEALAVLLRRLSDLGCSHCAVVPLHGDQTDYAVARVLLPRLP